jgi:hypothetical protein
MSCKMLLRIRKLGAYRLEYLREDNHDNQFNSTICTVRCVDRRCIHSIRVDLEERKKYQNQVKNMQASRETQHTVENVFDV